MDYFVKKELELLKGETEQSQTLNFASQVLFADKLKKGLGDEIVNYLKNPPKPNKKNIRKYKRKLFWENLKFRLAVLFEKN